MARFFLTERGLASNDADVYVGNRPGTQDDTDIRHLHEQTGTACGRCTSTAALRIGGGNRGRTASDNLRDVFTDISRRKMYLTGGVGSTYRTESFTAAFDLPNRTAYSESCAAIALVLFAARMRRIDRNARYGDVAERVLYQRTAVRHVAGRAILLLREPAGDRALRVWARGIGAGERKEHLPIPERLEVFGCSCCPPNINRFSENSAASSPGRGGAPDAGAVRVGGIPHALRLRPRPEAYATAGTVTVEADGYASDVLAARIPAWSGAWTAVLNGKPVTPTVQDGYAYFPVPSRFTLELDFGIAPVFVTADPRVRADAGRVARTVGCLLHGGARTTGRTSADVGRSGGYQAGQRSAGTG